MNERNDNRLPAGLIWLLIFQWLLVLVSLSYAVGFAAVIFINYREAGLIFYILVLAPWGAAMAYASVQMTGRRPRGFLVGMICHLLLAILSNAALATFAIMGVLSLAGSHEGKAWAPLFLLFALMWSPVALFSSWGFFYLRRLRKDLLAYRTKHAIRRRGRMTNYRV